MAVKQASSFSGVEANDTRPGSKLRQAHLDDAAGDLALLYERLTDESVESGTAAAVAGHIHDGTTGALMRIPWVQQTIWATLAPRAQSWATSNTPAWEPYVAPCFFVPAGHTTARAWIICPLETLSAAQSLRVVSYDASGATNNPNATRYQHRATSAGWFAPNDDGNVCMYWDIDVTAGEVNYVLFEAWDGYSYPDQDKDEGEPIPGFREVHSFGVGPVKQPIEKPLDWTAPIAPASTTAINVADSFQHFDSAMTGDDFPVSSFVATWAMKNLGLCYEVCTSRPAPNLAIGSRTHTGHNHGDDGSSSLNSAGADIDANLAAWSFGTAREPRFDGAGSHWNGHTADGSVNPWDGRIVGVQNSFASSTAQSDFAKPRFRVPAGTDVNIGLSAGTTKLKATFLVYKQDTVDMTCYARLFNSTGSIITPGAQKSNTSGAVGGWALVTVSDLEVSTDATGNGDVQLLELGQAVSAPKTQGIYAICSACVYWEA